MKTVLNKKVSYVLPTWDSKKGAVVDQIKEDTYGSLIELCCNRADVNPNTGQSMGYSYDLIKKIDRVKSAIKACKDDKIKFEDADYEFVKEKVSSQTWGVANTEFATFTDYIKSI